MKINHNSKIVFHLECKVKEINTNQLLNYVGQHSIVSATFPCNIRLISENYQYFLTIICSIHHLNN